MKLKVLSHVWLFAIPWISPGHGILQARIQEWVAFPFSRESSQPRDQTQVFCIAGRFFNSWTIREAQEYWSGQVGSLSLLQRIFPTQESNWGLLQCRQVFYQMSYQGSLVCLVDRKWHRKNVLNFLKSECLCLKKKWSEINKKNVNISTCCI